MIQALPLRKNLLFTQRVGGKKNPKMVDELLYRFGLEDRADFFPHQLSGGQHRRLMTARALTALLMKKGHKGLMAVNAVAAVMLFLVFTSLIGVCASVCLESTHKKDRSFLDFMP